MSGKFEKPISYFNPSLFLPVDLPGIAVRSDGSTVLISSSSKSIEVCARCCGRKTIPVEWPWGENTQEPCPSCRGLGTSVIGHKVTLSTGDEDASIFECSCGLTIKTPYMVDRIGRMGSRMMEIHVLTNGDIGTANSIIDSLQRANAENAQTVTDNREEPQQQKESA